jgi:phenylalanyl-tRNA synthetase beta chain
VLLESAHFSPSAVRGSAKKLGMHTDASHRFERGTDFSACLRAARRAAELICEVAGGTASEEAVDLQASEPGGMAGTLDLRALERFSGTTVERGLIERVLPALGFEIAPLEADSWSVSVPSWRRFDLEADENGVVYSAHFYEEALRFHGYDRVAATLPEVGGPDAGSSRAHRRREKLRLLLAGTGLAETITYGFYDQASDRRFPTIGPDEPPLRLTNALSEQYGLMRRSLLPNLVEGARFNLNRGQSSVRLFEIGHVFPGGASDEIEVVGLVLGGELGTAWTRRRELDLFDLKGVVEEMASRAGLSVRFAAGDLAGFVGGTGSTVHLDGEDRVVGYMGQVDEPELTVSLFGAELETAALDQRTTPKARVPSRFPGVAVDLTLTHASRLPWARISGAIEERRPQDLVSFELKDRYSGAGVPKGSVNTTISFFYNSDERSLTRDEVNERHERLAAALRTVVSKEV